MAVQRPLVLIGGAVTQLPLTDSLPGSGSGNAVAASLAFGATFTDKAQTVLTGLTWVAADSKIVPSVLTPSGVDPDEMYLLDFRPYISNLVAGVGFTVTLYSQPRARGTYTVNCIGV
jgi:hypothetical protein